MLFTGGAGDEGSADRLLNTLAGVIANRGSNNSHLGGFAGIAVVLNPEHAEVLHAAGLTRADIQNILAERATTPREELESLNPKMLKGREARIPAVRDATRIQVVVAGAPGLYSIVMPSWCAGPHGNQAVHAAIELDQFCELPTANH